MKTYTKEEARKLFLNNTHQIEYDKENKELLGYVLGVTDFYFDWGFYVYKINTWHNLYNYECKRNSYKNMEIIKLSQIIDEKAKIVNEEPKPKKMTFKYTDLQYKSKQGEWVNIEANGDYEMRFKPDYSKEIEALEKKAAEYGEKVIINFESI